MEESKSNKRELSRQNLIYGLIALIYLTAFTFAGLELGVVPYSIIKPNNIVEYMGSIGIVLFPNSLLLLLDARNPSIIIYILTGFLGIAIVLLVTKFAFSFSLSLRIIYLIAYVILSYVFFYAMLQTDFVGSW